jgi:hypothetical protein
MTVNYVEQNVKPVDDGSPSTTPSKININDQFARAGYVLASSAAASATLTGTTNETAMATVTIPAAAMGANGRLVVTAFFSGMTSSANTKTPRFRFNGIAGTAHGSTSWTTKTTGYAMCVIHNRNSAASQHSYGVADRGTDFLQQSNAATTSTVDTSAAVDLVISMQLGSGAEAAVLDHYSVMIYPAT